MNIDKKNFYFGNRDFLLLLGSFVLGRVSRDVKPPVPTSTTAPTTTSLPSLTETPIPASVSGTFKVTRVVDGDTIEIEGGEKVRYIGIDTPETVDPRNRFSVLALRLQKE